MVLSAGLRIPLAETLAEPEVAVAADVETTVGLEPPLVLLGVPVVVDEIVVVGADGELETIALVVAGLMLELKISINNKLERKTWRCLPS